MNKILKYLPMGSLVNYLNKAEKDKTKFFLPVYWLHCAYVIAPLILATPFSSSKNIKQQKNLEKLTAPITHQQRLETPEIPEGRN